MEGGVVFKASHAVTHPLEITFWSLTHKQLHFGNSPTRNYILATHPLEAMAAITPPAIVALPAKDTTHHWQTRLTMLFCQK